MRFRLPRIATAATLLVAIVACGGPESTEPDDDPAPGTLSIALGNQGQIAVSIGSTASVPVTVSRSGSFSGPVTIQVLNLPSGVTAAAVTIAGGQTAGNLTLTAAVTAARTATAISATVSGSGSGVPTASRFLSVSVN